MKKIKVIGAGLAGCEAAWQIAKRGVAVELYEMRPEKNTPAHKTEGFAELVCSNSLRGAAIENAVGLLKEEMRCLDSLVIRAADMTRVPAGGALAVDRDAFSAYITATLRHNELITVKQQEVESLADLCDGSPVIVATGPLTSDKLAVSVAAFTGAEYLYFYDAAAPIVYSDSLDMEKVFRASRYDKGDGEYLNCPMDKEQYLTFWQELLNAERAELKTFEKMKVFEGCMPIEVMAERGVETMRFGPLKPVGLVDNRHISEYKKPQTDLQQAASAVSEDFKPAWYYAVVQLRQDNYAGTLYNMVGFQTHLKWGEQERVFRMIPGMERAEFARFGVMHRNTFINSPTCLKTTMQTKKDINVLFAGQMTGVEGYVESASNGIVAGINAIRCLQNENALVFPEDTAIGALCAYITNADAKKFQPMNINFGLLPEIAGKRGRKNKKEKNIAIAERALNSIRVFCEKYNI